MERKVGEIFEYNEEWYQCIVQPKGTEGQSCSICSMNFGGKCPIHVIECAMEGRSDGKSVIFKKLEKVGEPYMSNGHLMQTLSGEKQPNSIRDYKTRMCYYANCILRIEIKQNKEDMEEKKLNFKPFDLEAAKAGKPVCTRDGRKARIICFDRNWEYPIVALIECENGEEMISACDKDGKARIYETQGTDLMMLPQKKEGWVRIYKSASNVYYLSSNIYKTEEEAKHSSDCCYVGASKISWEE